MDNNDSTLQIQAKIERNNAHLLEGKSDLSLSDVFNHDKVQTIMGACREYRERVYTPFKTLLMFTKQVLQSDKSCRNAMAMLVAERLSRGEESPSINTGPYCKARARLPENTVKTLVTETAKLSMERAPHQWKWRGHHVQLVDRMTIKTPDTEANYIAFGTGKNHQGEAGFPVMRLVTLISLSTGTVMDYAVGKARGKGTGEHSLLRSMMSSIQEEDILLGDCYYPSFYLLSDLQSQKAHGVFQAVPFRKCDFRKGKLLGKNDHLIEWRRPGSSSWLEKKKRDTYPKTIQVREFKFKGRVYVTTFLEAKKYSKRDLVELYKNRWRIELNLRDIKTTMSMEMLSCKTPHMARKELGVHLLAYNLIRILMMQSCLRHKDNPLNISFKGTIQLLNQFMPYFCSLNKNARRRMFYELLDKIVLHKVNNRPGRIAPRVVKRSSRSKYPLVKCHRPIEERVSPQIYYGTKLFCEAA